VESLSTGTKENIPFSLPTVVDPSADFFLKRDAVSPFLQREIFKFTVVKQICDFFNRVPGTSSWTLKNLKSLVLIVL
jgi:hypothetical protein